jgi:preprotein translocase subunit YajC
MTSSILMTAAAAAGQPSGTAAFLFNMAPLLMIFIIMWFLIFRPQQRQMRDHRAMIAAVKKGDEVITGGGIRGKVTKVTDDETEVEIAQGVRIRVVKSTLSQVVNKTVKPAND